MSPCSSVSLAKKKLAVAQTCEVLLPPRIHPRAEQTQGYHVGADVNGGNTQRDFVFTASPANRVTCLLAIFGALLHSLFVVLQAKRGSDCWVTLTTSLFAGGIAWAFAGFDVLSLKLDPNVLQTYLILGFLFSYIGIDVIVGKGFPGLTRTRDAARNSGES